MAATTNNHPQTLQPPAVAPLPVAPVPNLSLAAVNAHLPMEVPHVATRTITVLPEQDPYLSPASDLRVTRRVGQDGLVVAWLPSPDQECAGYLICINDQETQRVRSAQRTKAVLCGLDLQQEMELCIYSLSTDGRISVPARTSYHPECDPYATATSQMTDSYTPAVTVPSCDVQLSAENVCVSLAEREDPSPREVVVQTFYTNSSVTVRSSRRVTTVNGSRIPLPVRAGLP